ACAYWASHCSDGCAGCASCRRSDPRANRMRSRFTGNRIRIEILVHFVATFLGHEYSSPNVLLYTRLRMQPTGWLRKLCATCGQILAKTLSVACQQGRF